MPRRKRLKTRRPQSRADRFAAAKEYFARRQGEIQAYRDGNAVNFSAASKPNFDQAARLSHFNDDPRVTTEQNPYSNVIIRTGDHGQKMDILAGKIDKMWERFRNDLDPQINWTVEVIVDLSTMKRNRCIRVVLLSPELRKPDTGLSLQDHYEDMIDRKSGGSTAHARWNYFFDEDRKRFNDKDISRSGIDKNITVDGALRLIRRAMNYNDERITVDGNPIIRVSLASSCGVVLSKRSFDTEFGTNVVGAWLQDMKTFLSGDNRNRLWSKSRDCWVRVDPDLMTKEVIGLHNILRGDD